MLRQGPIAIVAPLAPIDRTYSFYVPDELTAAVVPGVRVEMRLGEARKPQSAFCVSVAEGPWETTLKPVERVLDARPLLSAALLELGRWISRYYACPLGHTLHAMVPAGARLAAGTRSVRYVRFVTAEGPRLTPRQAAVLDALKAATEPVRATDLATASGASAAMLRGLEKSGRIAIETRRERAEWTPEHPPGNEPAFDLNEDQQRAVKRATDAVLADAFRVLVLHGVTGSGKTECYVRTIRAAIAAGKQAIVLVPEIALTTQTAQRLSRRFERVAVVHSGLSDAQRARLWAAIADGQIPVIIGTRSAVFAPCPRLGVVVVDEEPEPSFKNQASPRYHTRDVAVKRAQLERALVILGSATPSLETWLNARTLPHYELVRLPRRVRGLSLPSVHLVDMREEHRARKGVHLLSRAMETHLEAVLRRGEQAVLLLNRRGFASYLFCPSCNTPIVCPNCSVHMVFHLPADMALCHYCHERMVVPNRCAMAGCGGPLVRFGMGTQRVEAELRQKFPQARVARLDSDAMKTPDDYARVLGDFEGRRLDVLVGTQMVAKGLDFPFVSFVGVVSADTALALPDFRATERTFQLVLQVAGRSGRGDVGGHVVVQTFASDLAAIRLAVRQDYERFAESELQARKLTRLPPHARLVRVVLSDPRLTRLETEAAALAERIRETLAKYGASFDLFAVQPSPIPRLRNEYRYDVILRFGTAAAMLKALDLLRGTNTLKARVRTLIVDVDPVALQ